MADVDAEYAVALHRLKYIGMLKIIAACLIYIALSYIVLRLNTATTLPNCIVIFLMPFGKYLLDLHDREKLRLRVKYGLEDETQITRTKQMLTEITDRVTKELGLKPFGIVIVANEGKRTYIETQFMRYLVAPLRIEKDLNEKQIEFLVARALYGHPWNWFSNVHFLFLALAMNILLSNIGNKLSQVYIMSTAIAIVIIAMVYIFTFNRKTDRQKYTKILAYTKDYQTAKSALIAADSLRTDSIEPEIAKMRADGRSETEITEYKKDYFLYSYKEDYAKLSLATEELGLHTGSQA